MCKNIVNIMLDNKLPENTVDMIMKFHKSIPDKINDKIKQCIKNDNYKLTEKYIEGRGGKRIEKNIEIVVDKNNIKEIFENRITVHYTYPTKYGYMSRCRTIDRYTNEFIWFDNYKLYLNKFTYLKINEMYDHITISVTDD